MSNVFYDLTKKTIIKADDMYPRHSEASILELKDGSLLIAWQCHFKSKFGSNDESPSNISLMNSYDNGATWENRRVFAEMIEGCTNVYSPSLFRLDDGKIALFFKRYIHLVKYEKIIASYYKIVSDDEGKTWSEEEILFDRQTAHPLNHGIKRLSDGSQLLPIVKGEGGWLSADDSHSVAVMRSEDNFKTWTTSNWIGVPMRGLMEPCVAECTDGSINMVMRTQLGSVFYSKSFDGGRTWSKPQTTGLKAPESCPCIVSVPNSDAQIVIWNNSDYDMNWRSHYGKRTPLTMAVTRDSFKTFTDFYDIETDPDRVFTNPSVTVTSDGLFLLNYWSCPYRENGSFGGLIDLKLATFKVNI